MTRENTRDLEPGDPGAFDDWPQYEIDMLLQASHRAGRTKHCPVCKGHGGWNLQLNAYPLGNKPDEPAQRHMFAHRRAVCDHCHGWGWIYPQDNCPRHDWVKVGSRGRCLHLYQCSNCGATAEIDTSD